MNSGEWGKEKKQIRMSAPPKKPQKTQTPPPKTFERNEQGERRVVTQGPKGNSQPQADAGGSNNLNGTQTGAIMAETCTCQGERHRRLGVPCLKLRGIQAGGLALKNPKDGSRGCPDSGRSGPKVQQLPM